MTRFEAELVKRIGDEIKDIESDILVGHLDHDAYKVKTAERWMCLKIVDEIIPQVNKVLREDTQ